MRSPGEHIDITQNRGLEVKEAVIKEYKFNRYLYILVGEAGQWTDKLKYSDEAGHVEIAYFGLAEKFIGQGFAGYFLSQAIETEWVDCNATRVWVHTCSLDHRNTLANYQAVGLKIYDEETC